MALYPEITGPVLLLSNDSQVLVVLLHPRFLWALGCVINNVPLDHVLYIRNIFGTNVPIDYILFFHSVHNITLNKYFYY